MLDLFGLKPPKKRSKMGKMTVFDPPQISIIRQGSIPQAPATLDEVAANLWREILTDRRLTNRAELTILEMAAQAYSRAERLRVLIETEGEMIDTGTGSSKPNGCIALELTARALCSRLLGKLRAPEDRPKMGRPANRKPSA
jgi:phage terminase small subunit